ncbi:MAG: adenylate/guanylate cyclase domain-containing protein [Pseudomonadota bacterium]
MREPERERRLAAIMVADAVGYSTLMSRDEERTHDQFKYDLESVIKPTIRDFQGEVVKTTGDGILALFPTVIQAVRCADQVQRNLCRPHDGESPGDHLTYRVGVNLGDILIERGDVYGNDVNVAVRLEALAEPCGIILSGAAFWSIKDQTELQFEEMGFLSLKNIPEPIEVYRLVRDRDVASDANALAPPPDREPALPPAGPEAGAPKFKQVWAESGKSLPSLIVLPFDNLSQDPEQEYFCDGLTNDITTDLSKFANLFVISANTALSLKGAHPTPETVRQRFGVDYMVEGSVQRFGNHIRINAQLIEAESGHHVWADRLQRQFDDLFTLQEQVVRAIIAPLAARLGIAERERAAHKQTDDASAYEAFLKGQYFMNHFYGMDETRSTLASARAWLNRAIELDPDYARAWGWLAYTYIQAWRHGWESEANVEQACEMARKAVSLKPMDHDTHWALGSVLSHAGHTEQALAEYQKALEINRNDADLFAEMGEMLVHAGEHHRAINQLKFAMQINPHFPDWYCSILGWAYYLLRDYEEAIAEIGNIVSLSDDEYLILAASHARLAEAEAVEGRDEEAARLQAKARRHIEGFLKRRPDWTVAKHGRITILKRDGDLSHYLEGLRLAGLPA